MKELSIEEKAKRYDEAVEIINDYYQKIKYSSLSNALTDREVLERAFPEIKESEDERIRKELIEYFRWNVQQILNNFDNKKVLTWLEKQGEQEILCDKCRKEHPSHSCQDITELGRCAVEHEQKSADKVKPKFHKGEWIVHHGTENIYQVVAIIGNQYQLKYGDNYTLQNCVDVDRCARLWNITKDAKDGDVLAAHECYVIFKEIDGLNIKCYCTYHYIGLNPSFYVDTLQNKDAFYPATKEQCDQLKKAMTDAGHTFDFEKKELRKIEQNPAPMSLDEAIKHCKEKSCGNNACALEHKQLEKWLTELKELKEQKSAWSEEDEKLMRVVVDYLIADNGLPLKHINWLKSLKERYTWRPSDEQMNAFDTVLVYNPPCSNECRNHLITLYNDLKKLREE